MPKFSTFPTLYDEVLQISISKLKEWGYLEQGQIKCGIINWSRNGNQTGSISIRVNNQSEQQYIELDYKFKEKPQKYKVGIVSIPANIGNGKIFYFLCPHTNKRCRKLYSINGYFLHRQAFKGCMYEKQTKSKKSRNLDKFFEPYYFENGVFERLNRKHFKKSYAGKPTKIYLKLMAKAKKAENNSYSDFERLLIG